MALTAPVTIRIHLWHFQSPAVRPIFCEPLPHQQKICVNQTMRTMGGHVRITISLSSIFMWDTPPVTCKPCTTWLSENSAQCYMFSKSACNSAFLCPGHLILPSSHLSLPLVIFCFTRSAVVLVLQSASPGITSNITLHDYPWMVLFCFTAICKQYFSVDSGNLSGPAILAVPSRGFILLFLIFCKLSVKFNPTDNCIRMSHRNIRWSHKWHTWRGR